VELAQPYQSLRVIVPGGRKIVRAHIIDVSKCGPPFSPICGATDIYQPRALCETSFPDSGTDCRNCRYESGEFLHQRHERIREDALDQLHADRDEDGTILWTISSTRSPRRFRSQRPCCSSPWVCSR
jgi:hypothetical protein